MNLEIGPGSNLASPVSLIGGLRYDTLSLFLRLLLQYGNNNTCLSCRVAVRVIVRDRL